MQGTSSIQKTVTSTQHNPVQRTNLAPTDVISVMLAIAFPAAVVLTILGCRKYQATVLRRRIKRLNRLWHLSSSQKLF